MKFYRIAFCLVALTRLTAFTFADKASRQSAFGLQPLLKEEWVGGIASERFFQSEILSQFTAYTLEEPSAFEEMDIPSSAPPGQEECQQAFKSLSEGINSIEKYVESRLSLIPIGYILQVFVGDAIKTALSLVTRGTVVSIGSGIALLSTSLAFGALKGALSSLTVLPFLKTILVPAVEILTEVQQSLERIVRCVAIGNSEPLADSGKNEIETGGNMVDIEFTKEFDERYCGSISKLYRAVVNDAASRNPAAAAAATTAPPATKDRTTTEKDRSPEMTRLTSGSLALLGIMDMDEYSTSAAAAAEAVASHSPSPSHRVGYLSGRARPIFAGDVLEQYREGLIMTAEADQDEDTKLYALTSLALVVSIENALAACLNIAANPVQAAEESNMVWDEDEKDEI